MPCCANLTFDDSVKTAGTLFIEHDKVMTPLGAEAECVILTTLGASLNKTHFSSARRRHRTKIQEVWYTRNRSCSYLLTGLEQKRNPSQLL